MLLPVQWFSFSNGCLLVLQSSYNNSFSVKPFHMKIKSHPSLLLWILPLLTLFQLAPAQTTAYTLLIETSMGNMKCILYEQTPMHTENFVELVKKGTYNGVLFHRVIKDFMIQTGDPESKNAPGGDMLGSGGVGYTIPAEFHPDLYHKKGAIASARQGDQTNPNRESNGSQFYIVQGEIFTDAQLDHFEKAGAHIRFTAEQRMLYKALGGSPHLDYAYTVFGEVVEGLEVIDAIAAVQTDRHNRPLKDVKVNKISILE
jgi:peptidyl-prolyl cis-trans isomerase B (cyclophilin B)